MSIPQLTTITSYSLLQSIIKIPQYVSRAKELGYQYLAMTDKGNLSGMLEFIDCCQKEGIHPIIGLSLDYHVSEQEDSYEMYLYAKNNQGLKQLMTISSIKEINGTMDWEELPLSSDLVILLPEKNELIPLFNEATVKADRRLKDWIAKFGIENLFYGIAYQGMGPQEIWPWYQANQLKPLAYHAVTSLEAQDSFAVRVARHIKEGTQIQDLRQEIHDHQATGYLVSPTEFETWFEENDYQAALQQSLFVAQN